MFNRLRTLLFGSVSVAALAQSGALDRLAREEQAPPGTGWRVSPGPNHAGRWTLWSPEGLATGSFPTREGAERYAVRMAEPHTAPPQEYAQPTVDDLEAARVERRTAKAPELAAPYSDPAEAETKAPRYVVQGANAVGPSTLWDNQEGCAVREYTRRRNAQAAADRLNAEA